METLFDKIWFWDRNILLISKLKWKRYKYNLSGRLNNFMKVLNCKNWMNDLLGVSMWEENGR